MRYSGRVFRPPSEAYSLIVQVTYGCSHNTCAFCDMYREKRFAIRPMEEVREDFRLARRAYKRVERIFLADGDALARRTGELLEILQLIREEFPECQRVTCYASPSSIRVKSEDDLLALRAAGLAMVYMGLESGCDEVLTRMTKGHTAAEIVAMGQKVRRAGIALSVTAITGLGSYELSQRHALDTAAAFSAMNPEFIGMLTLHVEEQTPVAQWVREGSFRCLDPLTALEEERTLIANIDSPGSVFRSNHASNYLALAGTFNRDKEKLLRQIDLAVQGGARLRPEEARGL